MLSWKSLNSGQHKVGTPHQVQPVQLIFHENGRTQPIFHENCGTNHVDKKIIPDETKNEIPYLEKIPYLEQTWNQHTHRSGWLHKQLSPVLD